jgi:hypothetical protein
MKSSIWSYLDNPFENITKENLTRALLLTQDHIFKLKQATEIDSSLLSILLQIETSYHNFETAYQQHQNLILIKETLTAQIQTFFTNLPAQLEELNYLIIEKYRPSTTDYQFIMAENRSNFYKGKYENRLNLLLNLTERLQNYPDLGLIYTEIKTSYQEIYSILEKQKQVYHNLTFSMNRIEELRQNLTFDLHYVWASLLMKYIRTPKKVEEFYDLSLLQRKAKPLILSEESIAKETNSLLEMTYQDSFEMSISSLSSGIDYSFLIFKPKNKYQIVDRKVNCLIASNFTKNDTLLWQKYRETG